MIWKSHRLAEGRAVGILLPLSMCVLVGCYTREGSIAIGPFAQVYSVQQAASGDVLAFSETVNAKVWIVYGGSMTGAGVGPFCVTKSGRCVIAQKAYATERHEVDLLLYTLSEGQVSKPRELNVKLPAAGGSVDNIRADDAHLIVPVRTADQDAYVTVDLHTGQARAGQLSDWQAISMAEPPRRAEGKINGVPCTDYVAASGAVLRELRGEGRLREIRLVAGGQDKLLMRQSLVNFPLDPRKWFP